MGDGTTVEIDRPSMDDLAELVDLWVDLAEGQRAHGSHLRADGNRDRIRESIARQTALSELHIARVEGDIVGFVMYTIEESTFEQSARRGVIQNIYVVPAFRGRRIGSHLLEAAERALADSGADVVGLDVMAANTDACRFYRHHGYDTHRITMEKPTENDTS